MLAWCHGMLVVPFVPSIRPLGDACPCRDFYRLPQSTSIMESKITLDLFTEIGWLAGNVM
jgi:hypothetical protein